VAVTAADRDIFRVLTLLELWRQKSRIRWSSHEEETALDLRIDQTIHALLADPDDELRAAAELLTAILRAQISGSKPRGQQ
jgi:hypothetical protein